MSNPTLKMSNNWNNKLDCIIFSSFRRRTEANTVYYCDRFNRVFDILLNKRPYCTAKLVSVRLIPYRLIPLEALMLDTGYMSREAIDMLFESFGIMPDDDVIWLCFKRCGEVAEVSR